jgi:hypothetical protein
MHLVLIFDIFIISKNTLYDGDMSKHVVFIQYNVLITYAYSYVI